MSRNISNTSKSADISAFFRCRSVADVAGRSSEAALRSCKNQLLWSGRAAITAESCRPCGHA
nr:MAG TPA: hypothetical protein [Caudoviricetes sp.]